MTTGKSFGPFHLCSLYPSSCASWALNRDKILFRYRNSFIASAPNTYEQPLVALVSYLSRYSPVSVSFGSDQSTSQNTPFRGGS